LPQNEKAFLRISDIFPILLHPRNVRCHATACRGPGSAGRAVLLDASDGALYSPPSRGSQRTWHKNCRSIRALIAICKTAHRLIAYRSCLHRDCRGSRSVSHPPSSTVWGGTSQNARCRTLLACAPLRTRVCMRWGTLLLPVHRRVWHSPENVSGVSRASECSGLDEPVDECGPLDKD
jgi:hypothetical protein